MCAAFLRSDYYEGSATPGRRRLTVRLPATTLDVGWVGRRPDASHVHWQPVSGVGIELYPGSITVSTPQTFLTVSLAAQTGRPGSGRATN